MRSTGRFTLIAIAALLAVPVAGRLGVPEAQGVIGRPLTPVSYAGVARRTSRRTARRTVAATSQASAGTITTLPAGCARTTVGGTLHYGCAGGVYYRPYYQGSTVVYRSVAAP